MFQVFIQIYALLGNKNLSQILSRTRTFVYSLFGIIVALEAISLWKKHLEIYVLIWKLSTSFFKKKPLYITCNGIQTAKKQVNCIIYQEIYLMENLHSSFYYVFGIAHYHYRLGSCAFLILSLGCLYTNSMV